MTSSTETRYMTSFGRIWSGNKATRSKDARAGRSSCQMPGGALSGPSPIDGDVVSSTVRLSSTASHTAAAVVDGPPLAQCLREDTHADFLLMPAGTAYQPIRPNRAFERSNLLTGSLHGHGR